MQIDPEKNPYVLFDEWYAKAQETESSYPNAMTIASVDKAGRPSARIVLLKEHDHDGFIFYTNFEGRKGQEILENPNVALCFYWKSLKCQIRIEGSAAPVSDEQAQAYFNTRPRLSRLGAWASQQSRPLESREALEVSVKAYEQQFDDQEFFPKPEYWSGFRVTPRSFEFWVEIDYRLHDRFVFKQNSQLNWEAQRLYP